MKALELVIYPLLEKVGRLAERGYIANRKPITYWYVENYQIFEKRLAAAELAAEFHKSTSDHYTANSMHMMFEDADTEKSLSDSRDWMFCMHRFATLPHYDEDQP